MVPASVVAMRSPSIFIQLITFPLAGVAVWSPVNVVMVQYMTKRTCEHQNSVKTGHELGTI